MSTDEGAPITPEHAPEHAPGASGAPGAAYGVHVTMTVNGVERSAVVDPRSLLVEVLRNDLGVTGPKMGCLTGDCGACTVRVDSVIVKSCLRLGVAEDGASVQTLESMATRTYDGRAVLSPLQRAFWERNAFQCGFCLSGMLFAAEDLLERIPRPDETQVRDALSGNLCRCTGYDAIVDAVLSCVPDEPAAGPGKKGGAAGPPRDEAVS